MAGLGELLFGKSGETKGGVSDKLAKRREEAEVPGLVLQRGASQEAERRFKGFDPTAIGREQIAREQEIARGRFAGQERAAQIGTQDAIRSLRDIIAQRGLGRSSIGLGQEAALRQQLGERQALIRQQAGQAQREIGLSLPERIRQLQQQRIQEGIGIGRQVRGTFSGVPVQQTQGSPGLAPLIGTGLGAYFGSAAGPKGALAGAQIGAGAGQSLSGLFGR